MTSRGDWVKVERPEQVGVGVALRWTGIAGVATVLSIGPPQPCCDGRDHFGRGVRLTDDPPWYDEDGVFNCLPCDIEDGTLLMLVLPPEATDDAEAVTRERERAR